MFTILKGVILGGSIMLLVACGGGGGSGGDKTPVTTSSSSSSSSLVNSSTSVSSAAISTASSSVPVSSPSSSNSSGSTQALPAPQNFSVKPGNATVTLSWSSVASATSYNVYYATESNILAENINAFQNGTKLESVTSPHTLTGLQNNKTYYFVVTATNGVAVSAQSLEVSATPSADDLTRQPTAQETLIVELINRARFDPSGEAARYGIGLNDGVSDTQITTTRKQPLAINLFITDAARAHSQWMLDNDIFSHVGENGSSFRTRLSAAGYVFVNPSISGENISRRGIVEPTIDLTESAFLQHEGLFKSADHRINIMLPNFREVGVGQKQGLFFVAQSGVDYLTSMITENFAISGTSYFLTGVIYADANGNEFYDVGEGLDGITISINDKSYPVYTSGAYSIPLSNGTYDLVITGASLTAEINYRVTVNSANVKLDVIKTGADTKVVSW